MGGLLCGSHLIPVASLNIIPPAEAGGPAWARLDAGDYMMRPTPWIRQVIVHTTGGLWPQPVRSGAGRAGHAQQIADMWSGADRGDGKRVHSAAQLIVDFDGSIACLCDLMAIAAYHAERSNPWSVGIEMSTMPDGSIYQATLEATARLVDALCWPTLPIPRQMHAGPYAGVPLTRMELERDPLSAKPARVQLGGPDCCGVFGHRDNTSQRGAGDPGDAIWGELDKLGFERFDYSIFEDIKVGRERQESLNRLGANLIVDGMVGSRSLLAAENRGFALWRDVPRRDCSAHP